MYLEVGCGTAALPFAMAGLAAEVLGLDRRVASRRPKAWKSNWPTIPSISRIRISSSSTGFHMREYDYRSLRDLFLGTGFSRVRFPLVIRGFRLATPPYPVLRGIELALQAAPARLRRARLAGIVMGITALATK
jgi:hypothetical protein